MYAPTRYFSELQLESREKAPLQLTELKTNNQRQQLQNLFVSKVRGRLELSFSSQLQPTLQFGTETQQAVERFNRCGEVYLKLTHDYSHADPQCNTTRFQVAQKNPPQWEQTKSDIKSL